MAILGPTNPPRLPIGHSDYAEVRRQGLTYVDKTRWIARVLDDAAKVILVPRPRRFGKTLNMTTLRAFVERSTEDRTDLFADTEVWTLDGGRWREHYQRYPVIYLTFKDAKGATWEATALKLRRLLSEAMRRCERSLGELRTPSSDDMQAAQLTQESTPIGVFEDMLWVATKLMHRCTGQPAIVLIDEYDSPLHAAWEHGYWDEAVSFFRGFLTTGLKDNPHLHKGVLTGILRVAKEGIFSGLNHVQTASVLSERLADSFGFTEGEVTGLIEAAGPGHDGAALRRWYNGYRFGLPSPTVIYNPWSVLSYLAEPGAGPRPFWKNTSDNALIRDTLRRHAASVGPDIQTLLAGGTVERRIDESVAITELATNVDAVWGLLLFAGYLTTTGSRATDDGVFVQLCIPNLEIRSVFRDTFGSWLSVSEQAAGRGSISRLVSALLDGDPDTAEELLSALLVAMLSHHDLGGDRAEAVYQAFVVGLLVQLEPTHRVTSNREAGYGRADVLITPRTPGPGAVLEFKRITPRETAETALDKAVAQLRDRDYAAEVRAAGATSVHSYGVVFDGKRCWVREVG
jgi:hypothetical protein